MEDLEIIMDIQKRWANESPEKFRDDFMEVLRKDGRYSGLDDALTWLIKHQDSDKVKVSDEIIYQYCYDFRISCPRDITDRIIKKYEH